MRCLLVLALLLPLASRAQSDPRHDAIQSDRISEIATALIDLALFSGPSGERSPASEAFFASASQALEAEIRLNLRIQDSDQTEFDPVAMDFTVLAHPQVTRVDSVAWSVLRPSEWSDELNHVSFYGPSASNVPLADSALVSAYINASGLLDHLATLAMMESDHPRHPLAELLPTPGEMGADIYGQLYRLQKEQFRIRLSTPFRYALRTVDPEAIQRATDAYASDTGIALTLATLNGAGALSPYIDALHDWTAARSVLGPEAELPPLALPVWD